MAILYLREGAYMAKGGGGKRLHGQTPTLWPKEGWPSPPTGGAHLRPSQTYGGLHGQRGGRGALRPLWPSPTGRPPSAPYGQKSDSHPDGQRAFGHPLPSAYGRGWLPLAIGAKEGRRGNAIDPMPKGAFGHPDGHPPTGGAGPFGPLAKRAFGHPPSALWERAAGPSLRP